MSGTATRPRPELEYLTDPAGGTAGGLVYDPTCRLYYRAGGPELAALAALAGGMGTAGAAAAARMSVGGVAALLDRAGTLGLLGPAARVAGRLSRSGLTLQVSLGDPSALLDRLAGALPRRGGRGLGWALAGVASAGLAALLRFGGDVPRLSPGVVSMTAILTVVLVTVVHELAHAVTLHAHGGKVRDWGVALMYLMPAAYTDCTQMWLLRRRRQRVGVMAAGIVAHLLLAGLAGLPLTVPAVRHSAGGAVLAAVATVNVLLALTNADPFLKLDGYWILAAVTGVDDLRRRALLVARDAVLRRPARAAASPALLWYGVASALWTGLLLVAAVLWWRAQLAALPVPVLVAAVVAVPLWRRRRDRAVATP